ncbi:MAG: hypothetical protein RL637_422 [Pseudomonadota bacterium]|jgi:serine/threonine protein kinase
MMNYAESTHCPNCFTPSQIAICHRCGFDRQSYIQQQAASHHLPLFTVLDRGYILGRVLGEGSFAIVYAAIREKDQLPCAVKEYYPQDLAQRGLDNKTVNPKRDPQFLDTWRQRFIQEAELLRCCYDYPSVESGVVRYMALINQHNTAYLVMQRLVGRNLSDYLAQQRRLSSETILLWLRPLLHTLQKLHAKEIYHRDISPNNIFLAAVDQPILMDFGLAREGVRDEVLKSSTLGAGTFIAPEQLSGGRCDQRTDLYALGAVIYLCLQGEPPPPVEARRQGAPLKQLFSNTPLDRALQQLSERCLALDLIQRPAQAADCLAQLTSFTAASTHTIIPNAAATLGTIIPSTATAAMTTAAIQPQVHTVNPSYSSVTASPSSSTPELSLSPLDSSPPPVTDSGWQKFGRFSFKTLLWLGIGYAAYTGYMYYEQQRLATLKQDHVLFAKARTVSDFKTYLAECVICESKQEASDKIADLEKQQEKKVLRKKQKQQEHERYLQAQTVEELQAYLNSCVLCLDKEAATTEMEAQQKHQQALQEQAQIKAEAEARETQLPESETNAPAPIDPPHPPALPPLSAEETLNKLGEKAKAEVQSGLDNLVDGVSKVVSDVANKAESELKANIEAEKQAAEAKAQAEAEAQKQREELNAQIQSQIDQQIKVRSEESETQTPPNLNN